MYPFPKHITPELRSHMGAHVAFANDMSKSLFNSFQKLCRLNIQLAQTILEDTAITGQQLVTAQGQTDLIQAAAFQARPAANKLRAYQDHLSRIAADAQVELANVAEQHVEKTTRTARALADQVARDAMEETDRGMRTQQEAVQQFTDPFQAFAAQPRSSAPSADEQAEPDEHFLDEEQGQQENFNPGSSPRFDDKLGRTGT